MPLLVFDHPEANYSHDIKNKNKSYNFPEEYKARRTHTKSRKGCLKCKARRVKCDEARPRCGGCSRGNHECIYKDTLPDQVVPEEVPSEQIALPEPSVEEDITLTHPPTLSFILSPFARFLDLIPLDMRAPPHGVAPSLLIQASFNTTETSWIGTKGFQRCVQANGEKWCRNMYFLHVVLGFAAEWLSGKLVSSRTLPEAARFHREKAEEELEAQIEEGKKDIASITDPDALFACAEMSGMLALKTYPPLTPSSSSSSQPPTTNLLTTLSRYNIVRRLPHLHHRLSAAIWDPILPSLKLTAKPYLPYNSTRPTDLPLVDALESLCTPSTGAGFLHDSKDITIPVSTPNMPSYDVMGPYCVALDNIRTLITSLQIPTLHVQGNPPLRGPDDELAARGDGVDILRFTRRLDERLSVLLGWNEPKGLLLVLYWLAVAVRSGVWWAVDAARVEAGVVLRYLDERGSGKIRELLEWPKEVLGWSGEALNPARRGDKRDDEVDVVMSER